MQLIDLSREIHHMMQRLPNHPSIEVYPFSTHEQKRVADGYEFSSATMVLHMGDHGGTGSVATLRRRTERVEAMAWQSGGGQPRYGRISPSRGGSSPPR
jgi:hypothetical protein